MGLIPFAATMRFKVNPTWGEPDARDTYGCTRPAHSVITSCTPCRSLVQFHRSFAVPPALQQFLAYIQRLDISRITRVAPLAQRLGVTPRVARGLEFARS